MLRECTRPNRNLYQGNSRGTGGRESYQSTHRGGYSGNNRNDFSNNGTNNPPPSSGNDQRKGPEEPSAEQRRAVHKASKFNQDNRFEEWKRRMEENDSPQTNDQ